MDDLTGWTAEIDGDCRCPNYWTQAWVALTSGERNPNDLVYRHAAQLVRVGWVRLPNRQAATRLLRWLQSVEGWADERRSPHHPHPVSIGPDLGLLGPVFQLAEEEEA